MSLPKIAFLTLKY